MDRNVVHIVGCGPAGMMIAHACWGHGVPFRIFSPDKKPSVLSGAQYLHRDIPALTAPGEDFFIRYTRLGSEAGYEAKIYGELPDGIVTSWSKFPDVVRAWPLGATYRRAWQLYSDRIESRTVTLDDMLRWSTRHIVFSTAPLSHVMPLADFTSETVWIAPGQSTARHNEIIYSGRDDEPWYRTSNIKGVRSYEYPYRGREDWDPADSVRKIVKPVSTNADIPGVHLAGRYGRWEKGVLVDDAYFQACEVLERCHT